MSISGLQKIFLGPAGLGGYKEAAINLEKIYSLGLTAIEIAFTYNIYLNNKQSKEIGEIAKKFNIKLSIHCPYWINLASKEKIKIKQSQQRILTSCERAHYLGASYVVFHPAFFGDYKKEEVYKITKDAILEMREIIKKNKLNAQLAPETTGKYSALGNLDELIKLAKETKCNLCVDFAHLQAREQGKLNYSEALDKIETLKLKHYHFHFSGIEWTLKGERKHINMNQSVPFLPLAKEILKRKINCTIISESPITWQDSLKMKKVFEKLGHKF
ncbi:MAG: TIM barrel protein [Patescibacteria group bacterium]